MKKQTLIVVFICLTYFTGKTQLNLNLETPIYMGGKGKQLVDAMFSFSFEREMWNTKNTIFMGIGFMAKVQPNEYYGTTQCLKYDYGSFNQSMPPTIQIDYYYKQKGLGLRLALDYRHYMSGLDKSGLYFSLGAGFDYLQFITHVNKFDDYNYYIDITNYPESPSKMVTNYTDSTRAEATGALNLRANIGCNIKLGENFMFFVECNTNYTPSGPKESVDYIFSRKTMIAPSVGIKLFWSKKVKVI